MAAMAEGRERDGASAASEPLREAIERYWRDGDITALRSAVARGAQTTSASAGSEFIRKEWVEALPRHEHDCGLPHLDDRCPLGGSSDLQVESVGVSDRSDILRNLDTFREEMLECISGEVRRVVLDRMLLKIIGQVELLDDECTRRVRDSVEQTRGRAADLAKYVAESAERTSPSNDMHRARLRGEILAAREIEQAIRQLPLSDDPTG